MKMGRHMNNRPKKNKSGYRARRATKGGRNIFKRRRAKGSKEMAK